jgi:hypothetical protein
MIVHIQIRGIDVDVQSSLCQLELLYGEEISDIWHGESLENLLHF